MPQLRCDNLSAERGGHTLFAGLNLALEAGEVCAIGGSNGVGKTSLIEVLAGLLAPSAGEVLWKDAPIHKSEDFFHQLAYVGHKNALKHEMTVVENLLHYAMLRETETLIPAALEYFDLTRFADVPCGELSSGWRRRVALAKLIVAPGSLWLLDEPTASLDETAIGLLHALIDARRERGGTILFTCHATEQMSDHVKLLNLETYSHVG